MVTLGGLKCRVGLSKVLRDCSLCLVGDRWASVDFLCPMLPHVHVGGQASPDSSVGLGVCD